MMCRFNQFLWVVLALITFAGFGSLAVADERNDLDPEEALEQLHEKQEYEERELKRLSTMALIPAGEFVMGRDGLNFNEEPAHTVHLNAFYLDKYEVTQLQYLSATGTNPKSKSRTPTAIRANPIPVTSTVGSVAPRMLRNNNRYD